MRSSSDALHLQEPPVLKRSVHKAVSAILSSGLFLHTWHNNTASKVYRALKSYWHLFKEESASTFDLPSCKLVAQRIITKIGLIKSSIIIIIIIIIIIFLRGRYDFSVKLCSNNRRIY